MRCWTKFDGVLRQLLVACLVLAVAGLRASDLPELRVEQVGERLVMDAQVKLTMPEEMLAVLRKGVPLVVVQEAQVLQSRWYWKDAVLARTRREWTLSYQALTQRWRVMLRSGQQVEQFDDSQAAWAFLTRITRWPIADVRLTGALRGAQAQLLWYVDRRTAEADPSRANGASGLWQLSTLGRVPVPVTVAPVRDALSPPPKGS